MTATALPCGTVYGALLNDPGTLARLGDALSQPPYKAPPRAPVLYIKTANTRCTDGAAVPVPADPGAVRVDATLGLVIGRTATRVSTTQALQFVAGYVIASDLTLPHDSVYRPAVRLRCRDGFLPMSQVFDASALPDPDAAEVRVWVDGEERLRRSFANAVRGAAQLIADVTEFMTLAAGDILLMGPPEGAPLARAGQSVRIEVPGLGTLNHTLVAEKESA